MKHYSSFYNNYSSSSTWNQNNNCPFFHLLPYFVNKQMKKPLPPQGVSHEGRSSPSYRVVQGCRISVRDHEGSISLIPSTKKPMELLHVILDYCKNKLCVKQTLTILTSFVQKNNLHILTPLMISEVKS